MDALAAALDDLERRGIRAKYIYTIPTVQNPTGTIMGEAAPARAAAAGAASRRADLRGRVLLRPGLGRRTAAGALRHEQDRRRHPHRLLLQIDRAGAARRLHRRALGHSLAHARAQDRRRLRRAWSRWCWPSSARRISSEHVPKLTRGLRAKLETLMEALAEQFGTAAEFDDPKGGIFLWVKLPDVVDTPEAGAGGARRRRRHQSRAGMVDRQGLRQEPAAAVLRPSLARRPSARASPRSPRSAAGSSACRAASPTWSSARARRVSRVHRVRRLR